MNSSSDLPSPFERARDGVVIAIRVAPRAKRSCIDGVIAAADGTRPPGILKVRVAAPPEAGKANDALVALLARECSLRRGDVRVISGHADRSKRVHLAGDPAQLLARLTALIERPT